jgi:uncharacterized protein (DUF2249 family)
MPAKSIWRASVTNKRIVYTRHDGGISVCAPTPEFLQIAKQGGWWNHLTPCQIEKQLQSKIARGVAPEAARRFAIAMLFGGLNEEQAYELVQDHDCTPLGHGCEAVDSADLPDRKHRNHWRRSPNGGPIWVDP